jgi:hypothetical protein
MGFYAHLEERQISPWDAFKPMWAKGSNNLEIFKASGANVDNFINTWASGVLRDESRGDGWDTTGPGITASKYGPLAVGVANGAKVDVSQPFFTNDITLLEFDADMVNFAIDGNGRLNDGSIDTTALDGVWYCVAGHSCEKDPDCPDAADLPDIVGTINGTAYLATSGGIDGTVGTVTGKDLEKDCATPTATADEFCSRYRDYVAWAKSNGSDDITKPLAGEIANRFLDMQPYAPAELAVHVALMIRVYSTYASAPPYIDLPAVGPDAAHIPEALTAMNNYCHVTFP